MSPLDSKKLLALFAQRVQTGVPLTVTPPFVNENQVLNLQRVLQQRLTSSKVDVDVATFRSGDSHVVLLTTNRADLFGDQSEYLEHVARNLLPPETGARESSKKADADSKYLQSIKAALVTQLGPDNDSPMMHVISNGPVTIAGSPAEKKIDQRPSRSEKALQARIVGFSIPECWIQLSVGTNGQSAPKIHVDLQGTSRSEVHEALEKLSNFSTLDLNINMRGNSGTTTGADLIRAINDAASRKAGLPD